MIEFLLAGAAIGTGAGLIGGVLHAKRSFSAAATYWQRKYVGAATKLSSLQQRIACLESENQAWAAQHARRMAPLKAANHQRRLKAASERAARIEAIYARHAAMERA